MYFAIATVLQIALVAAELFVLRAFVNIQLTQEWLLHLFWNGGGAAALSTAFSAHLLMLAVRSRQAQKSNLSNFRLAYLDLPTSPTSASPEYAKSPSVLESPVFGALAAISSILLLLFSLFTVVAASTGARKSEVLQIQPLSELADLARVNEQYACANLPTSATSAPRSPDQLRAVLAREGEIPKADIKAARAELASAEAAAVAQRACHDARSRVRAADLAVVSNLPANASLLRNIVPGMSVSVAIATYPMIQGAVAWLMLYLGSVCAHAIGHRRGSSPPRVARSEVDIQPVEVAPPPQVATQVATSMPVATTEQSHMTALEGLSRWLSEIERGSEDIELEAAMHAYDDWCVARGVKPFTKRREARAYYRERCDMLGIVWSRKNNKNAHRGVRLPK